MPTLVYVLLEITSWLMSRITLHDIDKTILELIDKANHANDIVALLLYEINKT
ncbi:MAG TPA: hypothetical protein VE548_00105 [Nitrososphaeraceae archaeon]|jgi:hypothetical protein|nr:hypothetical protein [Nitrososphaeraceae archaeon]